MEHLTRYINRIARLSTMYRNEKLKTYGLGGQHHTYINNICKHPGVSQEELAQLIFVNKSNVARQLAYLEKENYIFRKPSPTDKRKILVYPTEKAKEILPIIQEMLTEWNDFLMAELTTTQQEEVLEALKIMMKKAQEGIAQMEKKENEEVDQ